jgi:hypothetical protein
MPYLAEVVEGSFTSLGRAAMLVRSSPVSVAKLSSPPSRSNAVHDGLSDHYLVLAKESKAYLPMLYLMISKSIVVGRRASFSRNKRASTVDSPNSQGFPVVVVKFNIVAHSHDLEVSSCHQGVPECSPNITVDLSS